MGDLKNVSIFSAVYEISRTFVETVVILKFSQLPPGWGGGAICLGFEPFPNDVTKFGTHIMWIDLAQIYPYMHANFSLDATVVSEKGGYRHTHTHTHMDAVHSFII